MPSSYSTTNAQLSGSSVHFNAISATPGQRAQRKPGAAPPRIIQSSRQAENTLNGVKVQPGGLALDSGSLVPAEARHDRLLTTPVQEVGLQVPTSRPLSETDAAAIVVMCQNMRAEFVEAKAQLRNEKEGFRLLKEQLCQDKAEFAREKAEFKRAQDAFQRKERESQIRLENLEQELKEDRARFLKEKAAMEESSRKERKELNREKRRLQALGEDLERRERCLKDDRQKLELERANLESPLQIATRRQELRELQSANKALEEENAGLKQLRSLVVREREKGEEHAETSALSYRMREFLSHPRKEAKHVAVEKDLKKVKKQVDDQLKVTV